jgi:glycosyltransferase involved in cell wall biosynthesis
MRFVFVVPFRNCRPFLRECAESLLSQNHRDWVAFFRDDMSEDGGREEIPEDSRIFHQVTERRLGGLGNVHHGIVDNGLRAEDVVCILDGDDYLTRPDAMDTVARIYSERDCLLSYGQYSMNGSTGHCRAYSKREFDMIREIDFIASHLKTFRYSLYMEAMRQDPSCSRYLDSEGAFFDMAWDIALMTPLMEVAGFDRVAFNPEAIYHYRLHSMNEHQVSSSRQRRLAAEALAKPAMRQVCL